MPYVNLPPGNVQLAFADGGPPARANRAGGKVWVSDKRAAMINSMRGNGEGGLINGQPGEYGTGKGAPGWSCCGGLWYAWSKSCPRCGKAKPE